MNVKRYFGRTNREAMAQLRAELGTDAVVLKNRPVDGGVEILAMSDHAAEEADEHEVEGALPEMSTMSFQQYVRDRLAKTAAVAEAKAQAAAALAEPLVAASETRRRAAVERSDYDSASAIRSQFESEPDETPASPRSTRSGYRQAMPQVRIPEATREAVQREPAAATSRSAVRDGDLHAQARMLAELREMRSFIADQINTLSWLDGARRSPLQARLLRRMLGAGFSPLLTRSIISRLPSDFGEERAYAWLKQALAMNLHAASDDDLFERGGIYAMIGATGVGKTTSVAKIAARFALQHGAHSVGLVSIDAYRIGGQDQLRSYGKMLGVPVHVAHDAATLADFLHLFVNKKLVLIDTAGIGQRDDRVDELLDSLSAQSVRKLVVLNAASQAETLDDVIFAYRASRAAGVVISKIDEAVKLGGVLDCAIRHKLPLVGVANGQRVPEDWAAPDPQWLVDAALANRPTSVFELADDELSAVFQPESFADEFVAGHAHA